MEAADAPKAEVVDWKLKELGLAALAQSGTSSKLTTT